MDRRERYADDEELLRAALEAHQTGIWTAIPGIVQSFDVTQQTAVVQPALKVSVPLPDGTTESRSLPLLLDCPVQFPGAGGFALTFPVEQGDECLVVFASRCIDAWWQSGKVSEQAELRLHDLSDGFVLLGFSSLPQVLENLSPDTTQLRNQDASVVVELTPTEVNVTAPTVNVSATTAAVTAPTITLGNGGTVLKLLNELFLTWANSHTHTSHTAGSPTSAPIVPADSSMETSIVKAE